RGRGTLLSEKAVEAFSDTHCRVYLRQGLEADGLVHELAVLEVEQCRDAHDAVAGGQLRLGVHVDLADGDLAVVSLGELVEYRGLHLAGTAPGGPEVHDHLAAGDGRVESVGSEMSDSHDLFSSCYLFRSEEHTSELQSRFDLVCR